MTQTFISFLNDCEALLFHIPKTKEDLTIMNTSFVLGALGLEHEESKGLFSLIP